MTGALSALSALGESCLTHVAAGLHSLQQHLLR